MIIFILALLLTVGLLVAKPSLSRLAFRNVSRRLTQSVLVTMGLAASAMVFAGAQAIGDSLQHSLTSKAMTKYGQVGAIVSAPTGNIATPDLDRLTADLQANPASTAQVKVLTQPITLTSGDGQRTAVCITLMGVEPGEHLPLVSNGQPVSITGLAADQVYVSQKAATELGVSAGDRVSVTAGGNAHVLTVRAVVADTGLLHDDGVAVVRLGAAQDLLHEPGAVNQVLVLFPQGSVPGYMQVAAPVQTLRTVLASADKGDALIDTLRRPEVRSLLREEAARLNQNSLLALGVQQLQVALDAQQRNQALSLLYEPELQFWLRGLPLPTQFGADLDQAIRYTVSDLRNDQIRSAQDEAHQMTMLLLVFGVFAVGSGVILIFLIMSLLVQERIREIGILRAIGAKRRHVTLMMGAEGMLYSLSGGVVGVALGLGISYLLVRWMVGATSVTLFRVSTSSIILALGGSLLLNGMTILIAAYNASGFQVAEAVRGVTGNNDERRRGMWWWLSRIFASGVPLLMLGGCLYAAGQAMEWVTPVMLGLSLLFVGALQALGAIVARFQVDKPRVVRWVYSMVGLGLIVLWAVPTSAMHWLGLATYKAGLEVILLAGAMEVIGAICLVYHQGRPLFGLFALPFRLIRRWMPVVHYATVSAADSPRVNARTVAMVSLITFVVVMVFTTTHAISGNKNFPDMWLRGYQIRLVASEAAAVQQVRQLPAIAPDIEEMGSRTDLAALLRQSDTAGGWVGYRLMLGDAGYLQGAAKHGSKLAMRAAGFGDDASVWAEVQRNPDVAIITADAVVRRQNYNMSSVTGAFQLQGFYAESPAIPDVTVEAREPVTGQLHRYRVIGVMASGGADFGLFASDVGWNLSNPMLALHRGYFMRVKSASEVVRVQREINRALASGNVMAINMLDAFDASWNEVDVDNKVLGAFAGLGLFVGLAAIGVLSARAVVQRRQQIGVLRALGYKRSAVSSIFLIESSVLSATGLLIGAIPALLLSYDVIHQLAKESPAFVFDPPRRILLAFLVGSFVLSFVVTVFASWRAASISPAEALRYE